MTRTFSIAIQDWHIASAHVSTSAPYVRISCTLDAKFQHFGITTARFFLSPVVSSLTPPPSASRSICYHLQFSPSPSLILVSWPPQLEVSSVENMHKIVRPPLSPLHTPSFEP
ncbi:uncharacterized protein TrAFT101_005626 [Trichoderma asperellum]|uniref:uncharacterized protein n=1 Tax=Trichoderma asperellum TaxID=101201 RepID=UPI00332E6066|nr:hypothetical protein TrAFT101_005626 [Trichoderma asperellum]